jgi:ferritin
VSEQREEEAQFNTIINKLKIIGTDGSGLYLIDRDLAGMTAAAAKSAGKGKPTE